MKGDPRIPRPLGGGCQSVSIGATSAAATNPISANVFNVKVEASAGCHYRVSTSATATTADTHLAANASEFVRCNPGETITVIRDAAGGSGTLYVSEYTY